MGAFVPSIARLQAHIEPDGPVLDLERRGESDFFEALVAGKKDRFAYRLHARRRAIAGTFSTPMLSARLSVLSTITCWSKARTRGFIDARAHPITHEGVDRNPLRRCARRRGASPSWATSMNGTGAAIHAQACR